MADTQITQKTFDLLADAGYDIRKHCQCTCGGYPSCICDYTLMPTQTSALTMLRSAGIIVLPTYDIESTKYGYTIPKFYENYKRVGYTTFEDAVEAGLQHSVDFIPINKK